MTRDDNDRNSRSNYQFDRRSMLRALGAGSGAALIAPHGGVSAQEGDDGDDAGGEETAGQQCPPCLDRYAGYWEPGERKDENQQLEGIDPAATVELRVTDADVLFPDDEQTGPDGAQNETVGAGNETIGTGNETVGAGNETVGNVTEPADGAAENQTGGPAGNETEGEPFGELGGFPDFYFDPVGLHVQPGDTVEFLIREELHTVTAFHPRYRVQQRVPDAVPGFTSPPILPDDSWYYRFDEAGVYDLLCLPHLELGMVMRVVVVDEAEHVPEAPPDPGAAEGSPDPDTGETEETPGPAETEGPYVPRTALRVLNAPELEPQNVVEQGSVAWTDLTNVESEPPL